MTNFVNELETRYPTHAEIDAYIRRGRQLRAQAMREGLMGIRDLLQRAFHRAPAAAKPREA